MTEEEAEMDRVRIGCNYKKRPFWKMLLGVPLIYLPMYGNNAGKNYGTGGDFTVNSGPYPGARGPNEFWGNKADFGTDAGYLYRTSQAALSISAGSMFSSSLWVRPNALAVTNRVFRIAGTSAPAVDIYIDTADKLNLTCKNTAGTLLVFAVSSAAIPSWATTADFCIQISIDTTNSSNRFVYVNGAAITMTWTNYASGAIEFNGTAPMFGGYWNGSYHTQAQFKLAEFYFTTDYIDFSQEANRLKFRDAFGSPVALLLQIEAGAIPAPAIYLRFDPADQGRNDGTGGNFTKSGTITDGGQL